MKKPRTPRKTSRLSSTSRRSARSRHLGGLPVQAQVLEGLKQINLFAAGIDIGAAENYVAVPAHAVKAGEATVRRFGVTSPEQDAAVEWLRACRITAVAMEATGIYWVTLFAKLEAAGIQVILVDPHSVRAMPGRKSDVLDCQWLQQLHTYGLLRGAFRPDAPIRRLRTLTRQRGELVAASASHQQQMQKALIQMNVQLHQVVSDIDGETGRRIIEAIVAGERDPKVLVGLRDPRVRKSTVAEMEAALQGHYEEELVFVLAQNLEGWRFERQQLEACDQRILQLLESFPLARPKPVAPMPPKPVPAATPPQAGKTYILKGKALGRGKNSPTVDLVGVLQRICGVNLMAVTGLNVLSVLMLLGEIGLDMSRWRSAKAFCSWLGLCPGTKISGGKVLSRRTRRVVNRAAVLFRVVAVAVGRSDTWLGRFHRRKKAHLGAPKAVTATARKLACIVYHLLKYQEEFVPIDETAYEAKVQAQRLARLRREAKQLGMELVQVQQAA
jgi:transposase